LRFAPDVLAARRLRCCAINCKCSIVFAYRSCEADVVCSIDPLEWLEVICEEKAIFTDFKGELMNSDQKCQTPEELALRLLPSVCKRFPPGLNLGKPMPVEMSLKV
jgi:hypothetical protein